LWDFSYSSGMTVIHIEELYAMGLDAVVAKAKEVVGDGPTYVSFDVDGMDPVYAPGTGTPEVGGFTSFEAQQMLRGLMGINIVGADLVEVSPPFDTAGTTSLNGVQMMWELLCLMAHKIGTEKGRLDD
ncbi:MAG: agmatinase, partial [Rhodospirillaceae bacterium]|nr:agmatinase [Rhodospirillaceae bacterium]